MGEVKEGEGGGGGGEAGEEREVGTVLGGYVTRLKWEGWGAELGGGGGGGGREQLWAALGVCRVPAPGSRLCGAAPRQCQPLPNLCVTLGWASFSSSHTWSHSAKLAKEPEDNKTTKSPAGAICWVPSLCVWPGSYIGLEHKEGYPRLGNSCSSEMRPVP